MCSDIDPLPPIDIPPIEPSLDEIELSPARIAATSATGSATAAISNAAAASQNGERDAISNNLRWTLGCSKVCGPYEGPVNQAQNAAAVSCGARPLLRARWR